MSVLQSAHCRGQAADRPPWAVVIVTLSAWAMLGLACLTFWDYAHSVSIGRYQAPAGAIFAATGLYQLWISRRLKRLIDADRAPARRQVGTAGSRAGGDVQFFAVRPDRASAHTAWLRSKPFARWLLAGPVACYLAGLALGPDPDVRYFFFALLAVWYTATLVPLAALSPACAAWSRCCRWRGVRFAGRATFALLMGLALCEALLRAIDYATGGHFAVQYQAVQLRLAAGSEFQGRRANTLGYWDDEFSRQRTSGVLRIAALGRSVTFWGDSRCNCLRRLEEKCPGLEIYNFGLRQAGPREYAAQIAGELSRYDPDLVLLFLSIDEDLVPPRPLPGQFDWRSLKLVQVGLSRLVQARTDPVAELQTPQDFETYLNGRLPGFHACRTPITSAMERQWGETLGHLRKAAEAARRRDMPLALVLVPASFQVDPQLCETLRRRTGCQPSQIDLGLPQRRLTSFADGELLPVLDLLPYFQMERMRPAAAVGRAWNAEAHELTSRIIGTWLHSRFEVQLAAAD
jgi:hypothetical protein